MKFMTVEKNPMEGGEVNPENDLGLLRKKLDAAEADLAQVKSDREKIMGDLVAGKKDAAKKFGVYFERLKQAEQKAIDALEAWGNEAAKKANLKD